MVETVELFRSKKNITKFQILVEIMEHQPVVRQREIADTIGVTPQAISEYTKELLQEHMIHSDGRVRYHITKRGVEWVLENATDIKKYARFILEDIITHVTTWPALARTALTKGQKVALYMENGLLYAKPLEPGYKGTTGTIVTDANELDDVGVTDIKGMLKLEPVEIVICKIPRIERGGSKTVDLEKLKKLILTKKYIAAIGVEALTALRKINITPDAFFGTKESIIEAAYHGVSSLVVATDEEVPALLRRIEQEKFTYKLVEITK